MTTQTERETERSLNSIGAQTLWKCAPMYRVSLWKGSAFQTLTILRLTWA